MKQPGMAIEGRGSMPVDKSIPYWIRQRLARSRLGVPGEAQRLAEAPEPAIAP